MPESDTEYIDYYPSGWREELYDENYVEWIYEDDPEILVRLDGTMGAENYSVTPITGVNSDGEEYVTRPISGLSPAEAHDMACTLIYALNGSISRVSGHPEFNAGAVDR